MGKYSVGQKLKRTYIKNGFLLEETVTVRDINYDFHMQVEQYHIEHNDGVVTHEFCADVDASDKYKALEKAPTLVGKHRGRCECGAWTTPNPDLHSYWCPDWRKNGA